MKLNSVASVLAMCVFVLMPAASPLTLGQSASSAVKPSSGKALCSALTPEDFTKAGVAVSALRAANLDGTDGAYCVYDSKAGNVEFDIFFPAGATPVEVHATEKTVIGEVGATAQVVPVPGANAAHLALDAGKSSSIIVRKGSAVFCITIPKSANAKVQLIVLAQIVLGRIK